MSDSIFNLYDDIPFDLPPEQFPEAEQFLELARSPHVRIERIVSHGHTTPLETWYDQIDNEWVVVLKGSAQIFFDGDEEPRLLQVGDTINIPAHRRHRVVWTDPQNPTVWLAIHYK